FAAKLAHTTPGLRFLQVELDAEERPTYAFVPGVASTSLAHRVAERLGVTRSALRELMRRNNPRPREALAARDPIGLSRNGSQAPLSQEEEEAISRRRAP